MADRIGDQRAFAQQQKDPDETAGGSEHRATENDQASVVVHDSVQFTPGSDAKAGRFMVNFVSAVFPRRFRHLRME